MFYWCNDKLIIKLFVKPVHFLFTICMLFQIICMIQKSSPMTNDLWSWGNLQNILDFSKNNGCILKNNGFNDFFESENICLDTTIVNIA